MYESLRGKKRVHIKLLFELTNEFIRVKSLTKIIPKVYRYLFPMDIKIYILNDYVNNSCNVDGFHASLCDQISKA
jgi:hypothetical protein